MIAYNSNWQLVGRGNHRNVYVHPLDETKCIKIMHEQYRPRSIEKYEHKYYEMLIRRNCDFLHIPKYYGRIQIKTANGIQMGRCFDLIRDADGEISKHLTAENSASYKKQLHELFLWLYKNRIVSGFKFANIVVQKLNDGEKLYLIDGIGNTDYIPLANYAGWYARVKIKRRWRKFLIKTFQTF